MSKSYDPHIHCFVMVDGPNNYPMPIVLHTGKRVWIDGSYADEIPGAVRVNDGTGNDFDETGNCILSIDANICTYYDENEAENIDRCIEADDKLIAYAIG